MPTLHIIVWWEWSNIQNIFWNEFCVDVAAGGQPAASGLSGDLWWYLDIMVTDANHTTLKTFYLKFKRSNKSSKYLGGFGSSWVMITSEPDIRILISGQISNHITFLISVIILDCCLVIFRVFIRRINLELATIYLTKVKNMITGLLISFEKHKLDLET